MNIYVTVQNVLISNANAMQCMAVYGVPSATQWNGYFDCIRRMFNKCDIGMNLKVNGFNISYIRCNMNTFTANQIFKQDGREIRKQFTGFCSTADYLQTPSDGWKNSDIHGKIAWENPRISFRCNIALDLEIENYQDTRKKDFLKLFKMFFFKYKPCGGCICVDEKIRFSIYKELCDDIKTDLMSGSVLIDCTQELNEYHEQSSNKDILSSLMDFLVLTKEYEKQNDESEIEEVEIEKDIQKDSNKKFKWVKKKKGKYVPFTNGIRKFGIAPFVIPSKQDESLIFGESIITLAQFAIPTKLKLNELFWYTKIEDNYNFLTNVKENENG